MEKSNVYHLQFPEHIDKGTHETVIADKIMPTPDAKTVFYFNGEIVAIAPVNVLITRKQEKE